MRALSDALTTGHRAMANPTLQLHFGCGRTTPPVSHSHIFFCTQAPIKYLRIAIVTCVAMLMYVGLTKIRSGSIVMWRLQSPRTRHHTFNDNCIDCQFLRNNTTRRRYRFIILQSHHICAMASQISINSTLCSTAFSGLQQRSHLCLARSRVNVSRYR